MKSKNNQYDKPKSKQKISKKQASPVIKETEKKQTEIINPPLIDEDHLPKEYRSCEYALPLKRKFIFLLICVFVFLNLLFFPVKKYLVDHSSGVDFRDDLSLTSLIYKLRPLKAEIALLGNSMLGRGIDNDLFRNLIRNKAILIGPGGAASAWYFLVVKNILSRQDIKPKVIVLFFRDYDLTLPTYRVNDNFKYRIDLLCTINEAVLDKKAYLANYSKIELGLLKYWPLYQRRKDFKAFMDSTIKAKTAKSVFGYSKIQSDQAIDKVFADAKMVQSILTKFQNNYEEELLVKPQNFNEILNTTFLPNMVQICQNTGIQLVLLRVKKRNYLDPKYKENEALTKYFEDMKVYLKQHEIPLIDFSHDTRLNESHYADGDHLNTTTGIKKFTFMVAEALQPHLTKALGKPVMIDTVLARQIIMKNVE